MKKIILFSIIIIVLLWMSVSPIIEKKQYEELIKSRGFNIIIQNGSRLDRYKTVEFKSDKSKFRFIFYSMESYLRFEYCDIIQNICYIETYNEQAYESST